MIRRSGLVLLLFLLSLLSPSYTTAQSLCNPISPLDSRLINSDNLTVSVLPGETTQTFYFNTVINNIPGDRYLGFDWELVGSSGDGDLIEVWLSIAGQDFNYYWYKILSHNPASPLPISLSIPSGVYVQAIRFVVAPTVDSDYELVIDAIISNIDDCITPTPSATPTIILPSSPTPTSTPNPCQYTWTFSSGLDGWVQDSGYATVSIDSGRLKLSADTKDGNTYYAGVVISAAAISARLGVSLPINSANLVWSGRLYSTSTVGYQTLWYNNLDLYDDFTSAQTIFTDPGVGNTNMGFNPISGNFDRMRIFAFTNDNPGADLFIEEITVSLPGCANIPLPTVTPTSTSTSTPTPGPTATQDASTCTSYTWQFASNLDNWEIAGGEPAWASNFSGSVKLDPSLGFTGIRLPVSELASRLGLSAPVDASRLRFTAVMDTNGVSGNFIVNIDAGSSLYTYTAPTSTYSSYNHSMTTSNVSENYVYFRIYSLSSIVYVRSATVGILCNPPQTATPTVHPGTATAAASATAAAGTAAATATALASGPGQQPVPGGGPDGPSTMGVIVVDDGVSPIVPLHPCVIVDYKDTELKCSYESIPPFSLTSWYRWLSGWTWYIVCQIANLFKPLLWIYDIIRTALYSSMYGMCNARVLFENVNGIKNDISLNIISYIGFLGDLYELEAGEDIGLGCNVSTFRLTLKNFITGSVYIAPIWATVIQLLSFSILVSGLRMLVSGSFVSPFTMFARSSKRED